MHPIPQLYQAKAQAKDGAAGGGGKAAGGAGGSGKGSGPAVGGVAMNPVDVMVGHAVDGWCCSVAAVSGRCHASCNCHGGSCRAVQKVSFCCCCGPGCLCILCVLSRLLRPLCTIIVTRSQHTAVWCLWAVVGCFCHVLLAVILATLLTCSVDLRNWTAQHLGHLGRTNEPAC